MLPLGFWHGWDWSFNIHNLLMYVWRNSKISLLYIYMSIQNISNVSMRHCTYAEHVFHIWPNTSCFSTPNLVLRIKKDFARLQDVGWTFFSHLLGQSYSFFMFIIFHDQTSYMTDCLRKFQNCTVELALHMLWSLDFCSGFMLDGNSNKQLPILFRTYKILEDFYLQMALSGPVCVCVNPAITCRHNFYTQRSLTFAI